jgi:hypothetical protein
MEKENKYMMQNSVPQNRCCTFTFNSCDIRSLNNLHADLLHRITCETLLTPSSYDLQTAIEILYTEHWSFIPRSIDFPETSYNFWGPWTNPIHYTGRASIDFPHPVIFFFLTGPDKNDESRFYRIQKTVLCSKIGEILYKLINNEPVSLALVALIKVPQGSIVSLSHAKGWATNLMKIRMIQSQCMQM